MPGHRAHQSGDEFARANGFATNAELRAASRHIPVHEGPQQFVALAPDGTEVLGSDEDINEEHQGDAIT
jgi:hypothetical protein